MTDFFFRSTFITYLVTAFVIAFAFLTNAHGVVYNSDTLYLPALFHDVFVLKHPFGSWLLTPAPYFFPDMLIFFAINVFVKNVIYACLIYAVIQSYLFLFLTSQIAYLVTKDRGAVVLTQIMFLLALSIAGDGVLEPISLLLRSAFHFGVILNGLLFIYFLMRQMNKPEVINLAVIFFVTLLGVLSDLFFVVMFVFPVIGAMFISNVTKENFFSSIWKMTIIIILAGILGFLSKYFFHIGHRSFVSSLHLSNVFHDFLSTLNEPFRAKVTNKIIYLYILIFYCALIFLCKARLKSLKNVADIAIQNKPIIFLSFFIFFSVILAFSNIFFLDHSPALRYLINFFWFPFIFPWIFFINKTLNFKKLIITLYVIAAMIIIYAILSGWQHKRNNAALEFVHCIDGHVKAYNSQHEQKIKYGVSNYWEEKLITVFSQEGIEMAQYIKKMERHPWITTLVNYRDSYDFVVLSDLYHSDLDRNYIEKINGKPIAEYSCSPHIVLLIYGKGKLKEN